MGVILFVRHGQASWGAADYDNLSDLGHEQSRVTGSSLAARGVEPRLLVSGAMRRHAQTASGAASGAGWSIAPSVDRGWDEFDHVRIMEAHEPPPSPGAHMSKRELNQWFSAAVTRWASGEHDADYAESFDAFTSRVEAALSRLVEEVADGGSAVVFTSSGPITWVASTLLGGGREAWRRLNNATANASVTRVVVGQSGTTLVSVNEHGHLEPDHLTYR